MDKDIIDINKKVLNDFRKMAFEIFEPADAKVYESLEVPEHYTIVYFIPDQIKDKLIKTANELKNIDDSIILTPPDKYHITLFHCPITADLDQIKSIVAKYFSNQKFNINLTNLVVGALGIGIAGFPDDYRFVELRKELYSAAKLEFPTDYRASACWTLLGRFSQPPKQEIIQYVRDNFELDLGSLEIDNIKILKNHHKILEGAQEV